MVIPLRTTQTPFYLGNFFSSISFMDEKDNLGKGLNPRPLGYKGDSNHCINYFPLKTIFFKKNLTIPHCVGTVF